MRWIWLIAGLDFALPWRESAVLDGERDSGMVPHAGEAGDRSAELGLRPGLDPALRADGRGRVAGWQSPASPDAHLGAGLFLVQLALNFAWS